MANDDLQLWALPKLAVLLPLDEESLKDVIDYTNTLSDSEAAVHLTNLLGDSSESLKFIPAFIQRRSDVASNGSSSSGAPPIPDNKPSITAADSKHDGDALNAGPPMYAPPAYPPTTATSHAISRRSHTNQVIEAAHVRARDEQEMQNRLQNLQYQYRIYNSEIEPEHDTEYYCNCPIHQYQRYKYQRLGVQNMWSKAVMYPGEKMYDDCSYNNNMSTVFNRNPYRFRVMSPYGMFGSSSAWTQARPQPSAHATSIHQTIDLNNQLNRKAQQDIDNQEPKHNIWRDDAMSELMSSMNINTTDSKASHDLKTSAEAETVPEGSSGKRKSMFGGLRKGLGIKTAEESKLSKASKAINKGLDLRQAIEKEEEGRWPDAEWRNIVAVYQDKVGMTGKIADLRNRQPLQYLHLLRAGYFEPIPVAWAGQASNPLKFSIESAAGWRGITPAWRGYEDTAEERLYWVLNHREGSVGMRMKPDFISEMTMARARMASAVEPPPEYYSTSDVCHIQHTSAGYSKQVMPSPFRAFDRPEVPTDDTMILLVVSGSMDFEPVRPNYNQYLITSYVKSTQPKNKDVAKAIIRRFTDAMANHDHQFTGYELTTFSSSATHIGTINHRNLEAMWSRVRLGGGTRVMTGWQKVKELHFQKHSESATLHPVYGWQAGPQTPMLRLLLLLDGEATDMDEFELDLLGLSWAHVTIFLIGVDGCPHHHRHANELQRISDVNHHVSFVDAQGNTPERFVTHELLKRHLGYDIPMREFEAMEELPAYQE